MKPGRNLIFYKDYLTLGAALLISIILMASNNNRQIEYVKLWLANVLGVFQNEWSYVQLYFDLKEKNDLLRKENMQLFLENSAMQEMALENKRLKELIGFNEKGNFQLKATRVIAKQKKSFINDVILEIGFADSVSRNMVVVVPTGLVGKLYQVGKSRSNCQILLDQNFRVSAKIQRSREKGIVGWKGGKFCLLNEVPKHSDVKIGDWVITSGYGEIFPAGLRVGRVVGVTEPARGLFMEIKIKPAVNFDILEEVFVITGIK